MSNMIISCPSCPQKLRVPEELLGRPVKCPKCGIIFDAPRPASGTDPAPETVEFGGAPPGAGTLPTGVTPASPSDLPLNRPIRRDTEPGRGAFILTLGIVSIVLPVLGLIPAIAAIVMGKTDQKKIRAGRMDASAADTTQAGWICGIIGTVIQTMMCLGCCLYVSAVFVVIQNFGPTGPPRPPRPNGAVGAPGPGQPPFPPPPGAPKG